MVQITFVEFGGTRHVVEAQVGRSVMEAAKSNGVPGIEADCGGACACATCHVHLAEEWRDRVGPPSEDEREMLEFANDPDAGSRLSCQIAVVDDLDGLLVTMPESQR